MQNWRTEARKRKEPDTVNKLKWGIKLFIY